MLDSIYIGMSGLVGFSNGLHVISNNVTNLNTPGFKGSQLQFADMFYQSGDTADSNAGTGQLGNGLSTLASTLNFKPGEFQQTGNDLDLSINGPGFFVLKTKGGETHFTKAGQFQFDADGFLVNRADGARVQWYDTASGQLKDITLAGLRTNPPKATSDIKLSGNLSSTAASDFVLDGVKVLDSAGGEHLLKLTFKNNSATTPGSWLVTATDGTTTVGTGEFRFSNGLPTPGFTSINLTYSPTGVASQSLTLELSADATSFSAGSTSTLAVASSDGYPAGDLSKVTFDQNGNLVVSYSNGQSVKKEPLAVARFTSNSSLEQVGGNQFVNLDPRNVRIGNPGNAFGTITGGSIEMSNVDISQAFSDLIITQRGYQASSQLISSANEMIQQLFEMKGAR